MAVADLNYMELLEDTAVKFEFLLLEFWHDFLANVNRHQIEKSLCMLKLSLSAFNFASHLSYIVSVLEHSGKRLLSLIDVVNVLLCRLLFLC